MSKRRGRGAMARAPDCLAISRYDSISTVISRRAPSSELLEREFKTFNPKIAELNHLNIHPIKVGSRYRQVGENYRMSII